MCSKKLIYLSISFMTKFSAPAVPLSKECSLPFSSIYRDRITMSGEDHHNHQDKELISNVFGSAAHTEFSTCLACCKKTCDNT
nr:hypothetical protein [Tanacetum cinerariifolium]